MQLDELQYQIGLTLLDGIGDVLAKNLVAYCGSAKEVFTTNRSHLEKIPGIGPGLAKSIIQNKSVLERANQEINFIEENNITPLFFTDENYPYRLKNCYDSPVLLYYKGNADLNADKIISVVGTRTPSEYGKEITEKFVRELASLNCVVISGLAYGIDVIAHKASVEYNIPNVGVVAHGLDRIYPSVHKTIADRMVLNGGLLTDFVSGTNPDRENFPKRNRIVAGLCDALVVVESKRGGGSLITATIANAYNKDVFAFPGKAGDVLSEGCNGLIKTNKASLIEHVADLKYIMNWQDETLKKNESKQIPMLINLSDEEQAIVKAFEGKKQLHIDEISYSTRFSISKTSTYLLQLEFSNIVKSLPGKLYQLNN